MVVESKSGGRTIDVIIRENNQYQFIVFQRKSYNPDLYQNVSTQYRFRFCREYSDNCTLYNRYLLLPDRDKGLGVQSPRDNPSPEEYSAGDDGTFFKFERHSEVSNKIKEIISDLFG